MPIQLQVAHRLTPPPSQETCRPRTRASFMQLWRLGTDAESNPTVQHMGSLIGGHTRTVNCIRFSPTGADVVACRCDRAVKIQPME
jgi:WD40 repeat protein